MTTQPSELIQRVARAIVAELEEQQFGTESAWHDPEFRDNAFRCARAAIAAMREPTDAMIRLGAFVTGDTNTARECWRAMIQAALGRKDQGA